MALNRQAAIAAAEKLVARGKVEAAIKEYRKLLAENPNDASTLNRLGDLFVRLNRIDEAVRLFTQIADRFTEDGFFVKAIAIYKKIIKLDPTRLAVYERLAELYHKQGLVTEARTQYQVLVDYYQKHSNPTAAVNVLRRMAELEPEDPSPHVKLADLFRQLDQHDNELAEYRTIADLMVRHGRIDEATQVFMKAVAAAPTDIAFITDAVLGLKDGGHVSAAARLLAVAVEKNPQAEKIARLAGLGRRDRPGVVDLPEPGPRTITVNELIAEPPGRTPERPLPAAPPPPEPPREVLLVDEELMRGGPPSAEPPRALEIGPLDDELVLDLPEEGMPGSSLVEPTEEMLQRSPESPWFEHTSAEFEIEIEGLEAVEADLPPPAVEPPAPPATGAAAPLVGDEFGLAPVSGEAIEWDFEPEPELELELPEAPAVAAPVPAEPGRQPSAERKPLDLEELEKTSYEVVPEEVPVARRLDDLLAEAEVFAKYGLREKSHDRVREILHANPRHVGAFSLQLTLWLEEGRHDRVVPRVAQLHQLATEAGQNESWSHLRTRLVKAGYRFEDDHLLAGPAAKREKKDSVSALLEDLVGLGAPTKPSKPKPKVDPLAALTAELGRTASTAKPARVPPPPPTPIEPARPAPPRAEAAPVPVEPPAVPVPPPAAKAPAADESLAWLDRAPTPRGGAASADEALFEDEEGFFDLAAELEQELSQEELTTSRGLAPTQEQSLEEIVEGFKKGVAESLSAEDYDTHFNLGIAYREMGLLDEAIGEFQLAAKDPKYLIDCCSLLGASFLDKGLPDLAVRWYQRGLEVPDLPEEATLGLLYDLGNLYQVVGEAEKARKTFVEIYGINSNYRDVVARLEELGG